jgi:membrane fusion protein, multidrug efflux system
MTMSFSFKPAWVGLLAGLLAAWGAWNGMAWAQSPPAQSAQAQQPRQQPAPVVLGAVEAASGDVLIALNGSGEALRTAALRPAAAGEVRAVNFKAGDRVSAGQVLLRLDEQPLLLARELAASERDAAARTAARLERLRGTGAVEDSAIDTAQETLRDAEIALRQANEALTDRVLRAPFAGTVGLASVQPGDRVMPDTVVATLDDRRRLRVHFEVPEAYLAQLAPGLPLAVQSVAFPGQSFAGKVVEVDSRVDAVRRTLRLLAEVPNPDDVLRPGMSFEVRLPLAGPAYLSVPELALQWGRDGAFVWTVANDRAQQVPVRSVRRANGRVLVEGALQAGQAVVVEGVQRLREGRAVRVVSP